MSRNTYRKECLEEAARLRKKAATYQGLVDKAPGSDQWYKQHIADLNSWAEAAEKEARR
jgi:hypothetical protein